MRAAWGSVKLDISNITPSYQLQSQCAGKLLAAFRVDLFFGVTELPQKGLRRIRVDLPSLALMAARDDREIRVAVYDLPKCRQ